MIDGYFRIVLPEEINRINDPITYVGEWDNYDDRCREIIDWLAGWLSRRPDARVIFEKEPRSVV